MTTQQTEQPNPGTPGEPEVPETAQNPAPPKQKAKPTEYHILRLTSSSGADEQYAIVARNVKGVGAKEAVRNTITPTEDPQSFLAIPSRSMKLLTVRLQSKPQTIIE